MRTREIVRLFQQKESFLLLVHHFPDGDAIASSLGLYLALRRTGKQVDVVCADPIPPQFSFLPGVAKIKRDFLVGDYDVIVTLDCGDSRRTGFRSRIKELVKKNNQPLVNIDHHSKNDLHNLAKHNFVDEHAPSTSYLVYRLIKDLGVSIDYRIATCLLTGLYTDTGGFKHPNTTAETLQFAALMLSCGARLKDITTHINQASTVPRLRLWGIALSRLVHHTRFNIISTYLDDTDLAVAGASAADIAGITSLMMTIPADVAVLVVSTQSEGIQVRLRTKKKSIDLAQLAVYLGGGGQKKAAGFAVVPRAGLEPARLLGKGF